MYKFTDGMIGYEKGLDLSDTAIKSQKGRKEEIGEQVQ